MPTGGSSAAADDGVRDPARSRTLRRPRLEGFLDVLVDPSSDTRLALVCAGPGFGKTTLVRSWGETQAQPVAYVSFQGLSPGPVLFWRLVLRAITRADESTAAAVAGLSVPDREREPDFVVELADALATCDLLLVFDDLHSVTDPETLIQAEHLLRRLPSSVKAVVVSRREPTLPIVHDLRIAGTLHQVRAGSLAFTAAEVSQVCDDLDVGQQQLVVEQTEGWPAMVRLMHVALRDGLPVSEIWDREMGLFDHLFAEVFNSRAPAVQDVLLVSSLSDPAPLGLVVDLTGHADAGSTLDQTARQSGLISRRHDNGSVSYHLHPILRAFLAGELLRRDLKAARRAHRAAADWYLDHGDGMRAIQHVLTSEDHAGLEEVLARSGIALVNRGQSDRLVRVLADGPARVPGPWEDVVAAAALLDLGRVSEATARLENAQVEAMPAVLQAVHSATRCHLDRREGRLPDHSHLTQDLQALPADERLYCALHHGTHLLRQGDLVEAEQDLTLAVRLAEGLGRPAALVDGRTMLAQVSSATSDFHQLARRTRRGLAAAEESGWERSTRAAFLHLFAGWSARQSLDDVRARHHARIAMDLVDPDDDPTIVLAVHALHAATEYQTVDGVPADAERLHQLWRLGEGRFLSPELVIYAGTVDAHFSLALGRVDRLQETSKHVLDRVGDSSDWRLVEALHQVGLGKRGTAVRLLQEALEATPVVPLTQVEALAILARLRLKEGDDYAARHLVEKALALATQLGGIRPVADAGGSAVISLLRDQQGSWGHHEELVERLVEHVSNGQGLEVPLTERELSVLRQLPTMRTVEEIAATMVVSVNTVKTHLRNVYRKLGVTSRRDAVTEARRWGLL